MSSKNAEHGSEQSKLLEWSYARAIDCIPIPDHKTRHYLEALIASIVNGKVVNDEVLLLLKENFPHQFCKASDQKAYVRSLLHISTKAKPLTASLFEFLLTKMMEIDQWVNERTNDDQDEELDADEVDATAER